MTCVLKEGFVGEDAWEKVPEINVQTILRWSGSESVFKRALKRVGIIRWAYRLVRKHQYFCKDGQYSFNPPGQWLAAARYKYFFEHPGTFDNILKMLEDARSREILKRSVTVGRYVLLGKRTVDLKRLFGRKDYRLWVKDAVHLDRTRYDPLNNVFSIDDFRFYYQPPAPNAILYDHGLVDWDAPPCPLEYDAIFDVGGYIGDSAVILSRYLSSGGKVYSFEPDSFFSKVALKNASLNEVRSKIKFINKFVGNRADPQWITLDKFAESIGLDPGGTYLLKMDVEGYEREVLQSALEFIKKYRPVLIVAAYHLPDDIPILLNIIKKAYTGYRIYFRHHARPTPLIEYYYVAIPDTLTD